MGHAYRIAASDLERKRPIWFGGKGRSTEGMDMWETFSTSLEKEGHAPNAAIPLDKFHVVRHLGDALDEVRRAEYRRQSGKDRSYIKGQRCTLLSNDENLAIEGRA